MILNWKKVKIYIKPGPTDMRKQINGLAKIVQDDLPYDLFSGCLFLFCSRNRTRLKIIYWDKTGFCLWLKKLEKEKFPWPQNEKEAREITRGQLKMLLSGIDFFHKHQSLLYKEV